MEMPAIIRTCKTMQWQSEDGIIGLDFWVGTPKKTYDMSIPKETIPKDFYRMCHVYKGQRRLLPPLL